MFPGSQQTMPELLAEPLVPARSDPPRPAARVIRAALPLMSAATNWTRHAVGLRWGDKVLLLQNAPPSRRQLMWLAVLDAEPLPQRCAAIRLSELAGFNPFAAEAKEIHLAGHLEARRLRRFPGSWCTSRGGLRGALRRVSAVLPWTAVARSVDRCRSLATISSFCMLSCLLPPSSSDLTLGCPSSMPSSRYVGRVRHKAYMRARPARHRRGRSFSRRAGSRDAFVAAFGLGVADPSGDPAAVTAGR